MIFLTTLIIKGTLIIALNSKRLLVFFFIKNDFFLNFKMLMKEPFLQHSMGPQRLLHNPHQYRLPQIDYY